MAEIVLGLVGRTSVLVLGPSVVLNLVRHVHSVRMHHDVHALEPLNAVADAVLTLCGRHRVDAGRPQLLDAFRFCAVAGDLLASEAEAFDPGGKRLIREPALVNLPCHKNGLWGRIVEADHKRSRIGEAEVHAVKGFKVAPALHGLAVKAHDLRIRIDQALRDTPFAQTFDPVASSITFAK